MNNSRLVAFLCLAAFALLLSASPRAQTDDVFAFIPPGGKTLLTRVFESRPPAEDVQALLTGRRARGDWLDYLEGRGETVPAVGGFDPWELATLADYLAANMPLPVGRVPADPDRADWQKALPPDGRDLVMENCQFCHIITVVITQDKTRDAWLGLMNKPSHVEIELTAGQREALANYLVVNGAIPIDLVPEDLRAGGATY